MDTDRSVRSDRSDRSDRTAICRPTERQMSASMMFERLKGPVIVFSWSSRLIKFVSGKLSAAAGRTGVRLDSDGIAPLEPALSSAGLDTIGHKLNDKVC